MGVRVFQLAKELDMTSRDLIAYLRTQGLKVTSHMSAVDENVAQILKDRLPKKIQKTQPVEKQGAGKKAKSTRTAQAQGNGGTAVAGPPGKSQKREKKKVPAAEASTRGAAAGRGGKTAVAEESRGRPKHAEGEFPDKRPRREVRPTRKRFFPGQMDYGFDSGISKRPGVARRPRKKGEDPSAMLAGLERREEATIRLPITVKELSSQMGVKVPDIMRVLLKKSVMLSMNSYVEEEIIKQIGDEFQIRINVQKEQSLEDEILELENVESNPENLLPRAPVVTFLGHVDHGKTSLLDHIRETKVTSKEHGGITQHLGAYRVDHGDVHVVFIDTPGHKAFTEMRARGANITDVAVLVVAADEGVMPQTEEAYNHARAAGVPIMVALNKIDKPGSNPQRCHEQLSGLGLIPVAWGGETEMIEVSALTGQGIDSLLETLSLESEILELRADPTRPGTGSVLEAESNPGRGNLVTVLVQNGTLRLGEYVLCGHAHGRIRNMWLNGNVPVKQAGPATPVQISGLSDLPDVGERFYVFADPQKARMIAEGRLRQRREEDRAKIQKVSRENIWQPLDRAKEDGELRVVVKADVKGTLEALRKSLEEISTDEVSVKIIHSAVGAVGQDDILLADASRANVLGFNVTVDDRARHYAEEKQVQIRTYKVIYEALDDIRIALEDKLAPTLREEYQGTAEIRKVYRASKIGNIAGCFVRKGNIFRDSKVRLLRNDKVIYEGTLDSLKRFKEDAREVKEGFECGLKIAGHEDIQDGDIIEAFTIVKEKRNL